jgi:hypothetical protein
MDKICDFLRAFLYVSVAIVVVAAFFGTVANNGIAPQPGDPFFPAWLDITQYGWRALILVIPGVGAAGYLVISLFPDSGGF